MVFCDNDTIKKSDRAIKPRSNGQCPKAAVSSETPTLLAYSILLCSLLNRSLFPFYFAHAAVILNVLSIFPTLPNLLILQPSSRYPASSVSAESSATTRVWTSTWVSSLSTDGFLQIASVNMFLFHLL